MAIQGTHIITASGRSAIASAMERGTKELTISKYGLSSQDVELNDALTSASVINFYEDTLSTSSKDEIDGVLYINIDHNDTTEDTLLISLYLEDGTLFLVFKPTHTIPAEWGVEATIGISYSSQDVEMTCIQGESTVKADINGNSEVSFCVDLPTEECHAVNKQYLTSRLQLLSNELAPLSIGQIVVATTEECQDGFELWQQANIVGLLIEDYQELVDSGSFLVVDKDEEAGTFTLLGHGGRFLRPDSSYLSAGSVHEDAIRNITGDADANFITSRPNNLTGVFIKSTQLRSSGRYTYTAGGYYGQGLRFDASDSVATADENRPKALGVYFHIFIGYGSGNTLDLSVLSDGLIGAYKLVPLDYEESEAGWEEWLREDSEAKESVHYSKLVSAYLDGTLGKDIIKDINLDTGTFKIVGNGNRYNNYIEEETEMTATKGLWKCRDWKQIDGVYQYDMNELEIYDGGVKVYSKRLSTDVYSFNSPVTVNGKTYRRANLVNDISQFGAKGYTYTVTWQDVVEVQTHKVLIYTGKGV